MPRNYRLTPQARQDLLDIWQYSEQEWGAEQADEYFRDIEARLRSLGDNSYRGIQRDDIRPGYRSLPTGKHVIFFRPDRGQIEVVRILHGRMDVLEHFPNDSRKGE